MSWELEADVTNLSPYLLVTFCQELLSLMMSNKHCDLVVVIWAPMAG